MKTILIPTDFSETAQNATDFAINMFKDEDVKFILFNSVDVPSSSTSTLSLSLQDKMVEESEYDLHRERTRIIEKEDDDSYVVTKSAVGPLVDTLRLFIEQNYVHMVIMGTNGKTGFIGKLFGSNTSKIIPNVTCPLFVIPKEHKTLEISKAIFTSDSEYATINNEKLTSLCDKLVNIDILSFTSKNHNVANDIYNKAKDEACDLIIMLSHKHNDIENIFHHSVIKDITLSTNIPLLILIGR